MWEEGNANFSVYKNIIEDRLFFLEEKYNTLILFELQKEIFYFPRFKSISVGGNITIQKFFK